MDKKKKNINQPKNNTYWMYGLIISIFIIFSYIGNGDNFSTTKQINISTFEKYLNASEVSKVTIINKTLAEVTLTENALLQCFLTLQNFLKICLVVVEFVLNVLCPVF